MIERQPTWWPINFGAGIRAWLSTLMSLLSSRQRSSTFSTATGRSLSDNLLPRKSSRRLSLNILPVEKRAARVPVHPHHRAERLEPEGGRDSRRSNSKFSPL